MLAVVGIALVVLGLMSGAALVVAPFGLLAVQPGMTLWATFPLLCLLGFAFVATQARPSVVRSVSLISSAGLLMLALASVAVLVLGAMGLVNAPVASASLWFVLVVGIALGSIGAASFSRASGQA